MFGAVLTGFGSGVKELVFNDFWTCPLLARHEACLKADRLARKASSGTLKLPGLLSW
jgi:hypothetical protein